MEMWRGRRRILAGQADENLRGKILRTLGRRLGPRKRKRCRYFEEMMDRNGEECRWDLDAERGICPSAAVFEYYC